MGRWLDLMKRTIKKVLNCLMVLLLALSVFARNATIVSAADSTKGIEITVDRTELDNAIQAAKNAGVPVQKDQDVDNGVAQSKMEVDANIAAIKADYAAQIAAINAESKRSRIVISWKQNIKPNLQYIMQNLQSTTMIWKSTTKKYWPIIRK